MDIKNIWQVDSGSYGVMFLRYDIIGISIPFSKRIYADVENSIIGFYQIARKNDVVLLRSGFDKIIAIGIIAGNRPLLNKEFKDADGGLLHIRRIRWIRKTKRRFSARTLGSKTRVFTRVNAPAIKNWIKRLKVSSQSLIRPLKRLSPI